MKPYGFFNDLDTLDHMVTYNSILRSILEACLKGGFQKNVLSQQPTSIIVSVLSLPHSGSLVNLRGSVQVPSMIVVTASPHLSFGLQDGGISEELCSAVAEKKDSFYSE